MKYLLEISKIVTKKKVKKIEIFDDHSLKQKNSKFNDFYESLMAGDFKNDREAAKHLYNSSPTDDKYRQLKSRFKKRLLNTLFFLDVNVSAASNYSRAHYSCHKDWTLVKILLSNNAQQTAAHLARHILTVALKFDFADIIVNCSRILREQAVLEGNEKLFHEYDAYCKQFQIILSKEIESEEIYQRVLLQSNRNLSKDTDLIQNIEHYSKQLDLLSQECASPVILYNRFMVAAIRYEIANDYEQLYQVCEQAEQYVAEHPKFYREDKLAAIAVKKLVALLHLKDFERGKAHVEAYLLLFDKNKAWFDIMEFYLLLALHCKKYQEAHEIFKRVFEDKRFKKITGTLKEKWHIFEVYLCFLQWYHTEGAMERPKRYKQFRVKRFLEEPVIYPKNQRIFTVILVIGQVLFLLEEGRLGEAFERIERLKGYANRLLKQDEHFRIIQFVRLLQQLAKAYFNYETIGVHQKYLDRLEEVRPKYRGSINELEVLPYQDLWEMILITAKKHTEVVN